MPESKTFTCNEETVICKASSVHTTNLCQFFPIHDIKVKVKMRPDQETLVHLILQEGLGGWPRFTGKMILILTMIPIAYLEPVYCAAMLRASYLEPVYCATIDKRWEHSQPVSEGITNWAHCQDNVQILSHSLDEKVVHCEGCRFYFLALQRIEDKMIYIVMRVANH